MCVWGGGGEGASECDFMYPLTLPTVTHAWSLAAIIKSRGGLKLMDQPQKTAVEVQFHSLAHVWQ